MKTSKLTAMSMLIALSVTLVMFIHFPVIPTVPFMEYDPADIPMLIGSFAFGPAAGLVVSVIAAVIQGVSVSASSGLYGIIMHIAAAGTYVVVAGAIYRRNKTLKTAAAALIIGAIARVAVMIPANLIITPIFMGTPVEAVQSLMLYGIIPFNGFSAAVNGLAAFLMYKPVMGALRAVGIDKGSVGI